MKRIFGAALLALAASPAAFAQPVPPGPGTNPYCPPGAAATARSSYCCDHLGCGCFCLRFFNKIGFHGPLYNYGPYSGYYPFEPYGPWGSNLQWNGPVPSQIGCGPYGLCGKNGCGWFGKHGGCGIGGCGGGLFHGGGLGLGGLFHRDGCSSCGWNRYACSTFRNVFQRTHPLFHRSKCDVGCSACALAAEADAGIRAAAAEQKAD
jgi:hypothetical protein